MATAGTTRGQGSPVGTRAVGSNRPGADGRDDDPTLPGLKPTSVAGPGFGRDQSMATADGAGRTALARPAEPVYDTPESRHEKIALCAFYRAEKRGFAAGNELDDWLAAEQEVDARNSLGIS
jgi:hypothetical protein